MFLVRYVMGVGDFNCKMCGKFFESSVTRREMDDELQENFDGEFISEECEEVCGYCYEKIMRWYNERFL